jgi:hypothetical protein
MAVTFSSCGMLSVKWHGQFRPAFSGTPLALDGSLLFRRPECRMVTAMNEDVPH